MNWFAMSQGREVFSVPGHADSFVSKGTNQLLREGAKLVENADDIVEELEPILKSKIKEFKTNRPEPRQEKQIPLIKPQLSEEEARLFDLISLGALDLDDIVVKSQSSVSAVSALLLMLQLKKLVKQSPGKIFEKAQNEK